MFTAPRGYDDLIGDAEASPLRGDLTPLDVTGVGTVWARRPQPQSAAMLAAITRPMISTSERLALMVRFVTEHTTDEQIDDLMYRMMIGDAPDDTIGRVTRAICRWGTARTYGAVCSLSGMTGQHWRTIRQHLLANGVTDPMALPSLHALLDVTEQLIVESMQGKTAAETKMRRDDFYHQLYRPDPLLDDLPATPEGDFVPDGFEEGADDDAFDQAMLTI